MNTSALVTMIVTMGIVLSFTAYFFIKILRTPPKKDEEEP
jgi:hypothetical protein